MDPLYQDHWEETKRRYARFWKGQTIDGPLLCVTAPRDKPLAAAAPAPPADAVDQWLNQEQRIIRAEHSLAQHYYAGDAFPFFDLQLGPGSLAIHMGSEPLFMAYTIWYQQCIADITSGQRLRFDPLEKHWQWTLDFARRARAHFAGRLPVAFPDLIENLDILASLVGTDQLLLALIDHPQDVHRCQQAINEAYFHAYEQLLPLIQDEDGGTAFCAFQIWGPGRTAKVQSDISAMLSAEMYREFVVPYMEQQCQQLDNVLYHLDGVDAVKHLPAICAIKSIQVVQWTAGAGKPDGGDECWFELYRQILDAGKGVQIYCHWERVEAIVNALGTHGVMIRTHTPTQAQAQRLVEQSRGWR